MAWNDLEETLITGQDSLQPGWQNKMIEGWEAVEGDNYRSFLPSFLFFERITTT